MPEMPEVETIVRKLRSSIVGRTVSEVRLSGLPLRRPVPASLATGLRGRRVAGILRSGKYIVAVLEPRGFLLVHLGMSGRILFHAAAVAPQRHTHATLLFADGSALEYRDHRRFGMLCLYDVRDWPSIPELAVLGTDPLSPGFRSVRLAAQLAESRQEIKSFLLDQRRISGLGNIYVCEALYHARLHPARRCHTIRPEEARLLARAVRRVLRLAIARRGTSFSDFLDSDGEAGENQDFLRVFQREGERCRRCRSKIRRLRQGNRSSYYCPGCQR